MLFTLGHVPSHETDVPLETRHGGTVGGWWWLLEADGGSLALLLALDLREEVVGVALTSSEYEHLTLTILTVVVIASERASARAGHPGQIAHLCTVVVLTRVPESDQAYFKAIDYAGECVIVLSDGGGAVVRVLSTLFGLVVKMISCLRRDRGRRIAEFGVVKTFLGHFKDC
jgi:hypothetical protein